MKHTAFSQSPALLFALVAFLLTFSCTKPTSFGSGLLENEIAELTYTDTLSLRCTLEPEDSLVTSDLNSTGDYMLCGQLNDPIFGKAQSDIYTLFRLSGLDPDFENAVVDSIILYLRYDAPGFYGDTLQPQTLRVHRLATDTAITWNKPYYSNQSLPVGDQIGELANFLPTPNIESSLFDTATKAPYIRIPLSNAFGQELLNIDSLTLTADTAFWKVIRGLRFSVEPAGNPGALLAFDLNNSAFSRIRVFYKQDTIVRAFDFNFIGGNKFTHFTHDYTGAPVGPYIGQPADDRLFVQGMGGLRLKVEIPYAHLLGDVAINKAEFDFTAETLPNDNPLLGTAKQLVLTESLGDTLKTLISDVLYSLGPSLNGGFGAFGGFPLSETDQGQNLKRYRLTVTERFQAMVDNASGDIKNQTLYLNVYPQSRSAMRAVLFGPKSVTFPAKLALKYTKVQ